MTRSLPRWLCSRRTHGVMTENLFLHSPKHGAAPPPGGESIEDLNLLMPDNWEVFLKSDDTRVALSP
jgi:hypothetical protein